MTFDEARALRLLAEGSKEGFDLLYREYAPGIAHLALRMLKSKELTQDVIQDVFTKVWVERDKWSKVVNFKSYLFISVRNRIVDLHKKKTQENLAKAEYFALKDLQGNNVDDYLVDKELTEFFAKVVDDLPPHWKTVFTMLRDDGLTQKEVAARLNLDQGTVKEYLYNARVQIRKRLQTKMVISAHIGLSAVLFS